MNKPWEAYMKPFRIFGNLYFVGTYKASSHMIDTGDGLILIDTGYPQQLYLVLEGVRELGFNPRDIKYIVHSHGHYDHIGGTRALVELYGAKTYIGAGDVDYVDGTLDLTWARELGQEYHEAFAPDYAINDGDIIKLGETRIKCVSTPGHTPGTTSFFFDVKDGNSTLRAGMHGGVGVKSMLKGFLDKYGLSYECRDAFFGGLEKVKDEKVDIFIGNHVWNNDTLGKYKRMQTEKENPFIDKTEWPRFLDSCREKLLAELKNESAG